MIVCFFFVDYSVVRVNGRVLEIPGPAMNAEVQLCISFESSSSSGGSSRIVVLAHHTDDPRKLSAYSSHGNKCFTAPTAGNYSFATFTQNSDSTLEAPSTPPEILIRTVSTCKHSLLIAPHNSNAFLNLMSSESICIWTSYC